MNYIILKKKEVINESSYAKTMHAMGELKM